LLRHAGRLSNDAASRAYGPIEFGQGRITCAYGPIEFGQGRITCAYGPIESGLSLITLREYPPNRRNS
jgi:hypothetical protein